MKAILLYVCTTLVFLAVTAEAAPTLDDDDPVDVVCLLVSITTAT